MKKRQLRLFVIAVVISAITVYGSKKYTDGSVLSKVHLINESEIWNQKRKLNVILIYADDLGYGHLGAYGQEKIKTPIIDEMAKNGLLFTNFYSNCPYCFGARISLMTGRHLGNNKKLRKGFFTDSVQSPEFLPRYMQKAGYVTGIYGKWGFGTCDGISKIPEKDPYDVGFDEFLGYLNHRGAHTYTIPPFPQKAGDLPIDRKLWTIKEGRTIEDDRKVVPYVHQLLVEQSLEFLERHKKENFFLFLPYTIPHAELYVPQDNPNENLLSQYLDSDGNSIFKELPFSGDKFYRRNVAMPRATLAAMISRLDRDIGLIRDKLQQLRLDKSTLILITSDNGPHDAGGITGPDYFDATAGLRGMKWQLYEGGVRVPFIAYLPGTIESGRVETGLHDQTDLLPTLAEIAGVDVRSEVTGVSMMPAILHEEQFEKKEFIYWLASSNRFKGEGIRIESWKAVRVGLNDSNDIIQLFNLESDPYEKNNLADQYPDRIVEFKKMMNNARTGNEGLQESLYNVTPFPEY